MTARPGAGPRGAVFRMAPARPARPARPGLDGKRSAPARGLHDLEAMQRFASGPGPFAFFDAPWTPVFLFALFTFQSTPPWSSRRSSLISPPGGINTRTDVEHNTTLVNVMQLVADVRTTEDVIALLRDAGA